MSHRLNPIVVDSDDEDDLAAYYDQAEAGPSSRSHAYPSSGGASSRTLVNCTSGYRGGGPSGDGKEAIKVALAKLDAEIKDVVAQLTPLQQLHASLTAERQSLEARLASFQYHPPGPPGSKAAASSTSNGKSIATSGSDRIDYQSITFPWSSSILATLRSTFHLGAFRLCQEGVINAAMDDRDIVCVMPTGGGKSLTYQLPAIIGATGLTVVISPLIALIWDQVRALKEYGVEVVAMTGSTSTGEQNEIYRRLEEGGGRNRGEIRLCYVTPEKVSKSKRLMAVLEKVNAAGRLTRFVIDEAHCCSQLGHDFRPDYKKLSVLKQLFPRVPIQAVTATLSTKTLPDLLKILRLPPICDGRAALPKGTVFFTAPLYRPNLHYKVFMKPSSAQKAIAKIGEWIKANHLGKSGIIYCLSKKDTETVAEELRNWSNGLIKTGVYHAGIEEWEKERIHVRWRKGEINVICATIAFGLGIDKGDVRYVIHHSMSKSLDGYYQETGRAGRDGQDSDCVLFYRGQDASRMQSLIYGEVDGTAKLREMLRFAQDLKTCRKIAFAKYFSTSANLSANAWDHSAPLHGSADGVDQGGGDGMVTTCGQCDNCLRPSTSVLDKDVTLEVWRILRILDAATREGGRVTLASLTDLVRGLGGGSFGKLEKGQGRKRAVAGKGSLDVGEVAGGKVQLSKDVSDPDVHKEGAKGEDTEALLIHLTLEGYLEESYSANACELPTSLWTAAKKRRIKEKEKLIQDSINVYLQPGPKAYRLSRYSEADVRAGKAPCLEYTFLDPKANKGEKEKLGKGKKQNEKKELDRVLIKAPRGGGGGLVEPSDGSESGDTGEEVGEGGKAKKRRKVTSIQGLLAEVESKASTKTKSTKTTKPKSAVAKTGGARKEDKSASSRKSGSVDYDISPPSSPAPGSGPLSPRPNANGEEDEWDDGDDWSEGVGTKEGIWNVL